MASSNQPDESTSLKNLGDVPSGSLSRAPGSPSGEISIKKRDEAVTSTRKRPSTEVTPGGGAKRQRVSGHGVPALPDGAPLPTPFDSEGGHLGTAAGEGRRTRGVKASGTNMPKQTEHKGGIEESWPPMSKMEDIFTDLARKAVTHGLNDALKAFPGKKLRVATMCSGTDAPIIGLRAVQASLATLGNPGLQVEHCYSAEIDPLKQNLIAVNTDVEHIFRDVTEMAAREEASTVYGANHEVPHDMDMIIAGFSCVDFSHLNHKQKTLEDVGESGDTFNAIRTIARNTNPKILILENVRGAPWGKIALLFQPKYARDFWGTHPGFAVQYGYFDSKDYYIPHMRNRGYMVCMNRLRIPNADKRIHRWSELMGKLRRPASSSVEAFLLPPEDPRLLRAKGEMQRDSRATNKTTEVAWLLSRVRHEKYREMFHLGTGRPLTNWVEKGSCQPPDWMEYTWAKAQVERIQDTLEINSLRNYMRYGIDSSSKLRVWNLSQNVDRDTDVSAWGITQCLTPTGIHFLTLRGGPIVGIETLSLQGLPIDRLVLNRETDRELMDLSGNAMTTTLVTAAILSAIILVPQALGTISLGNRRGITTPWISHDFTSETQHLLPWNGSKVKVNVLASCGEKSVRLCKCEGHAKVTSRQIYCCTVCKHTACERCRGTPKHTYEACGTLQRRQPQDFIDLAKNELPMRVQMKDLSFDTLKHLKERSDTTHAELEAWILFERLANESLGEELRFDSIKRTHCWTISYTAPHSRLELVFNAGKVDWFLYAKPNIKAPGNNKVRGLLKLPIARMQVRGQEILEGEWEFGLPWARRYPLSIKRTLDARSTIAYESTLGLEHDRFKNNTVWDKICIEGPEELTHAGLDGKITGVYEARQQCGAAYGSLHIQVQPTNPESSIFFFLDPNRIGPAKADRFVFSKDVHRLDYGNDRHNIAYMEAAYRSSTARETISKCIVPTKWFPINARLEAFKGREAYYEVIRPMFWDPDITIGITNKTLSHTGVDGTCKHAGEALLQCFIPISVTDLTDQPTDNEMRTVDATHLKVTLSQLTFVLEKVRHLEGFSDTWRNLQVPPRIRKCKTCTPKEPDLKWSFKQKGRIETIVPYEDERQALDFEKGMSDLPEAFSVQIRKLDNSWCALRIGLNVPALAHLALAQLPAFSDSRRITSSATTTAKWRLDVNHKPSKPVLPMFILRDNSGDAVIQHQFLVPGLNENGIAVLKPGAIQLRADQKQALGWMLGRELNNGEVFEEREVQEAVLAELGWRAEVMVSRPNPVFGGVCADQVGFGKTATTIALIDSTMHLADLYATQEIEGKIPLRATLIIVPPTICTQWTQQVKKFLRKKYNILLIRDYNDSKKLTISDYARAHIVVVSWSLLNKPGFMSDLAYAAAVPPGPKEGGRPFSTWFDKAHKQLCKNVEAMKNADRDEKFGEGLNEILRKARTDRELIRRVPFGRLKGKNYLKRWVATEEQIRRWGSKEKYFKAMEEAREEEIAAIVEDAADKTIIRNPFNLDRMHRRFANVTHPPLHMFSWYRVVLDEWTYVDEIVRKCVTSIHSKCRWVLSGTPPLDSFYDIKTFAAFLGVHLGRDDDSVASMTGRAIKAFRKQRTSAELFRAFKLSFSHVWYEHRHSHAQEFLDFYVRQNSAKSEGIACTERTIVRPLAAMERILYMEMEQALIATSMRIVKPKKPIRGGDYGSNERILLDSSSGQAALLKRSTVLDISGLIDANDAGKPELKHRAMDYKKTKNLLEEAFLKYDWLLKEFGEEPYGKEMMESFENYELGDTEETLELTRINEIMKKSYNRDRDEHRFFDRVRDKTGHGALRVASNEIRRLIVFWRDARRRLKYVVRARRLQEWNASTSTPPVCEGCDQVINSPETITVSGNCGHFVCRACLEKQDSSEKCVIIDCDAPAQSHYLHSAATLAADDNGGLRYGTKVDAIVELIESLDADEQVLIFVQFEDLGTPIENALEAAGITFYSLLQPTDAARIREILAFQDNPTPADAGFRRVLVLNSSTQSSAGANLTGANHVIFVSPLLANSRHQFAQSYVQCIGRARRHGQRRIVHVHRFIALGTVDVDCYEHRLESRLSQSEQDGQWRFVPENQLTDEEMERRNGTNAKFDFDGVEDDD